MIAFTTQSQIDTSKICFPRHVIVSIQKDLIRLDYCDSILVVKDTIILNRNSKIVLKDSIINLKNIKIDLYKLNETAYEGKLQIKDIQIKDYEKQFKKQRNLKRGSMILAVSLFCLGLYLGK